MFGLKFDKRKRNTRLPNILVVDPDVKSHAGYQSSLHNRYRVILGSDNFTASEMAIIIDAAAVFVAHIPGKQNGLALLQHLKTHVATIPVVLVVRQPSADLILSAFRLGVSEVVKKPLDASELVTVAEKVLRQVGSDRVRDGDYSRCQPLAADRPEFLDPLPEITTFRDLPSSNSPALAYGNPNVIDRQYDIRVHFFGRFRVMVNGSEIQKWPSKKGRSLLAYLLYHRGKQVYRDVLMDLFWSNLSPYSARNCLNVTMHGLRRLLKENDFRTDCVIYQDEQYAIRPDLKLWLDVEKFRSLCRSARVLERENDLGRAALDYVSAASLYLGDFLENEIYQNWSFLERETLKEMYLDLLESLSLIYGQNGRQETAIRICEHILKKDSSREKVHQRKMVWHFSIGERDKALRQYKKCVRILKLDLGIDPSSETRSLYLKIKYGSL